MVHASWGYCRANEIHGTHQECSIKSHYLIGSMRPLICVDLINGVAKSYAPRYLLRFCLSTTFQFHGDAMLFTSNTDVCNLGDVPTKQPRPNQILTRRIHGSMAIWELKGLMRCSTVSHAIYCTRSVSFQPRNDVAKYDCSRLKWASTANGFFSRMDLETYTCRVETQLELYLLKRIDQP